MTRLDVALREASASLVLLRDARLPAARWERVETLVTRLEEAMWEGDADAVLGSARNLEDPDRTGGRGARPSPNRPGRRPYWKNASTG
jgi:hypothetical protein